MTSKSKLWSFIFILISGVILLLPFLVYAQTPIDCGQTLAGSISAAAEKDSYTFTASANDGITIRARKTSGNLTPYIEIYSPGGTLITGAANQVDRILTETGTYRIDVRDQNNTNTGDYLLFWQRMSNPCNATPINCGQAVTGSIGTSTDPSPWKAYTFTGTAGDAVSIRSLKTSAGTFIAYYELYGPNGSYIGGYYNSPLDRVLTATGTHTILMRDYYNAYAGDFFLTYQVMSNPCNATSINCGQMVSSSISSLGEMDIHTFSVSANDGVTIRIRKSSGTFSPVIELYGPTGSSVVGASTQIDRILTTAGTYKIIVRDGSYANTGNYLLYLERMNNPCNATPISCGQVVTGSIGATTVDPPPWKAYTFTGTAGDAVSIRSLKTSAGTFIAYYELYGPNGSYIGGSYTNPLDRVLTATGTHTILMRDYYNAYAGDFFLTYQVMSNPCNATSINCGQVVSSSISGLGEMDIYTFTASANDGVTIRVWKTSGNLSPNIELYGPTGSSVVGASTQINRILTTAGTYKIIVRDGSYANTGNYSLFWERMSNPCSASSIINCGQVVSSSISGLGEMDIYTFTASANQGVTIRIRKTAGTFTPNIELYGPTGNLMATSYSGNIDQVLTTAGTYKIIVRDYSYANTGDYLLYWQQTNNPCNATSISCGQAVTGSIGTSVDPPPWKAYTFMGTAGDAVTIRSLKTSAGSFIPYMELYGPNGSYITSAYNNPLDRVLTTTGTYTVHIRDYYNAYAGDFFLTYQVMSNPCNGTPLTCGQVVEGSIDSQREMDVYTFTVSANDAVTIRVRKISGGFTPYWELYNPSGSRIFETGTDWTGTLTTAGTYKVLVRDSSYGNTGSYLIYWQRWNNNPCATVLTCGQVVAGSIGTTADPPPWRYYSFSVLANDSVTIRASKTSGTITPYLELYNASGGQLGTGAAGQLDKTLTAAGTYTIAVRDQNGINTGEYLLTWLKVNNPCNARPIGCGQIFQGALNTAGKIDAYTITATGGDTAILTLTKTSGGLDPTLELYNSSGTRLAYQYSPSANQVTITQTVSAAGTYTVFASDYGNSETGSYTLKFQKNNNICPEVTLAIPNGGDRLVATTNLTISWTCTSSQGISSQEIKLSTDGGQTFPNLIATGLQGGARSYNWTVPQEMVTSQGRIRVTVTDTSGLSTWDDSDSNFEIYQTTGRIYVYDELNRLIQVIYEDGRRVTYTYDASGNRITLTNE